MPVSDDQAMAQFQIEALRQITDNLRRLNDNIAEQTKTLHAVDLRLTKIESNSVNSKVAALEDKVDSLERDRDKRDGATGLATWVFKNWPGVIGFIMLMFVVLEANRATNLLK